MFIAAQQSILLSIKELQFAAHQTQDIVHINRRISQAIELLESITLDIEWKEALRIEKEHFDETKTKIDAHCY